MQGAAVEAALPSNASKGDAFPVLLPLPGSGAGALSRGVGNLFSFLFLFLRELSPQLLLLRIGPALLSGAHLRAF